MTETQKIRMDAAQLVSLRKDTSAIQNRLLLNLSVLRTPGQPIESWLAKTVQTSRSAETRSLSLDKNATTAISMTEMVVLPLAGFRLVSDASWCLLHLSADRFAGTVWL